MSATKVLRLAVSAALLAWIAWQTNWSSVGRAFGALRAEYWLAALGLLLAAQVVSALRWCVFARALGFTQGLPRMTGYYFIGMFFNLVLPTSVGGDVMRAWYLDGRSGRRLAAFASVVLERLSGLMVLVALAGVAVTLSPVALPTWIPVSVWSVAGCGMLGLIALPLAVRGGGVASHRRRQVRTLLLFLRQPRTLVGTTLLSLVVQAAGVGIVWLIGSGLGAPVPASYYWIMAPMVSLLTLLPVSVNGMGVREGGVVLFLAPLGVEHGTALTLAFLWFLVYVAGGLLGGVVYMAGAFPKPQAAGDAPAGEEAGDGSLVGDSDQGRARQLDQAA